MVTVMMALTPVAEVFSPPLYLDLNITSRGCCSLPDVLLVNIIEQQQQKAPLTLQHERGSVVVEGYFCRHVTLWQTV